MFQNFLKSCLLVLVFAENAKKKYNYMDSRHEKYRNIKNALAVKKNLKHGDFNIRIF